MGVYGAMSALALCWCYALIIPSMAWMDDRGGSGFLRAGHDERLARLLQTSSGNRPGHS